MTENPETSWTLYLADGTKHIICAEAATAILTAIRGRKPLVIVELRAQSSWLVTAQVVSLAPSTVRPITSPVILIRPPRRRPQPNVT